MNEQPTKPKRRRFFRFTLRTLFVLLTVGCMLLGWKVNKTRQQREAVEWVEEMSGDVVYEYEFDANGDYIPDAEPPAPAWLRNHIGIDFRLEVVVVHLDNTQVSNVTPLVKLSNLKYLWLDNTKVSDVTPLAELTKLETLLLGNTQVNDVAPLAKLTNLSELDLSNTQVSEESIRRLQQALPNCYVVNDYDERDYDYAEGDYNKSP